MQSAAPGDRDGRLARLPFARCARVRAQLRSAPSSSPRLSASGVTVGRADSRSSAVTRRPPSWKAVRQAIFTTCSSSAAL